MSVSAHEHAWLTPLLNLGFAGMCTYKVPKSRVLQSTPMIVSHKHPSALSNNRMHRGSGVEDVVPYETNL